MKSRAWARVRLCVIVSRMQMREIVNSNHPDALTDDAAMIPADSGLINWSLSGGGGPCQPLPGRDDPEVPGLPGALGEEQVLR